MNRERDALSRRTDALATLLLSYRSSGELTSSLEKTSPQSLVVRVTVGGTQVKSLAKGSKPKVAKGVEPGPIKLEATWSRPGTRLKTTCEAELQVGFQEVLIVPYGGSDGFSCEVMPRLLPDDLFEEWKNTLEIYQARAAAECSQSDEAEGVGFWTCIEQAGIPLPQG
jgi:hypothetical protein